MSDFHRQIHYSCQHSHFLSLQSSLHSTFDAIRKLPYHFYLAIKISNVGRLFSSDHFRRLFSISPEGENIQVSCYALFKGWLLLSQPPCCIGKQTAFSTKKSFRNLNWESGMFPFCPYRLIPVGLTPSNKSHVFGVWLVPVAKRLLKLSSRSTP